MLMRYPRKRGTHVTAIVAEVNVVSTMDPAAQVRTILSASSAVSKKVLPVSGWHAKAESAGMLSPICMAALRLAMPPNDRRCQQ